MQLKKGPLSNGSGGGYILKEIVSEDIDFIFKGLSDPEVYRYYGVRLLSREDALMQMNFYKQLRQEHVGHWWIISDRSGTFFGAIGLNDYDKQRSTIEIGYWLIPEFWGRGIVADCLPLVEKYARDHFQVQDLTAWVERENTSSIKLLAKLGFEVAETKYKYEFKDGRWVDLLILVKKLT